MHYNFCIKNVTKCTLCYEPVQVSDMETHIMEAKGTQESWAEAIVVFDETKLLKMKDHGTEIFKMKDDQGQSILHIAVKGDNSE